MTAKKGLKSLAESNPEFSNQHLENAINVIKAVDKDDGHQFILSQFLVDEAIRDNTVLTTSQKNDVLESLSASQPHLQIGGYLNDVIRHTNTILDGSIIPLDDVTNPTQATFLEILQSVLSLQSIIPDLLGVPASEKNRDINDHLGTLNNKFLETEDSSAPVFTRLKQIMELIDTNSRRTSSLNLAITNAATANLNLRTFINGLVADSTDFQTSLDNKVNSVGTMFSTLNTRISEIPGDPTTDLVSIREQITAQVALEKSNLTNINTFLDNLNDYNSYTALAEDSELRKLMTRVSQNTNWITYFNEYEQNQANLNPLYNTDTDSDKSAVIDQVLSDSGLPDVTDPTDFEAVANKAKQDSRIDTRNYDRLTAEQQITDACKQLNITTANRVLLDQSRNLLNNLNQRDRDIIAAELDSNEDADTLT